MSRNHQVRQVHRWVSIAFMIGVIINLVALVRQSQTMWVGLLSLIPLVTLAGTGLYLFLLPYRARRRGGPGSGSTATHG